MFGLVYALVMTDEGLPLYHWKDSKKEEEEEKG